nr:BEL1-like homeodomain protein 2 [Tanacetum cinerariifolium]
MDLEMPQESWGFRVVEGDSETDYRSADSEYVSNFLYTALAQMAMSRHYQCLKDAIFAQLKHICELLGEKNVDPSGVTKGETPRLKMLEQSLRQQRAFHQMGMIEPEA